MKELTLREVQLRSLDLLIEITEFCKQNDLQFVLGGGTLLGAVRHKGFIPWDDDIDINFLRKDYEKLLDVRGKLETSNRKIISIRDNNFDRNYAKYVRMDCIKKENGFNEEDCPWLGIDIFPIDEIPNSALLFKLQVVILKILRKILLIAVTSPNSGKTETKRIVKNVIRPFACLFGSHRIAVLMDCICKVSNNKNGIYVAALTGMYGEREKWLKDEYMPICEAEFEGRKFPINKNYDRYLSNLYGDYMKLPPENKRKYTDAKVFQV